MEGQGICLHGRVLEGVDGRLINFFKSCSKLTMSLVNNLLKFQT